MSDDAEILMDYARRGDAKSLSALVLRHSPWMSALLRGMLPDADVEDALQDAWLKVIKSVRNFRGHGLKAYLGSVVRSVAIDRLRRCGRTESLTVDETGELPEAETLADGAPLPNERFESAATREDVHRAVRTLPEGPRQVLLLRIEAEMPFKDIAREMGIPLGTALTWMRVATVRLRKELGGNPWCAKRSLAELVE